MPEEKTAIKFNFSVRDGSDPSTLQKFLTIHAVAQNQHTFIGSVFKGTPYLARVKRVDLDVGIEFDKAGKPTNLPEGTHPILRAEAEALGKLIAGDGKVKDFLAKKDDIQAVLHDEARK